VSFPSVFYDVFRQHEQSIAFVNNHFTTILQAAVKRFAIRYGFSNFQNLAKCTTTSIIARDAFPACHVSTTQEITAAGGKRDVIVAYFISTCTINIDSAHVFVGRM
jgi:hypothetical protein